jgi:hypothetical protein
MECYSGSSSCASELAAGRQRQQQQQQEEQQEQHELAQEPGLAPRVPISTHLERPGSAAVTARSRRLTLARASPSPGSISAPLGVDAMLPLRQLPASSRPMRPCFRYAISRSGGVSV